MFVDIHQQASKAIPPDASDVGNTIRNRFYGTKSLDTDDVDFTALRLHAMYRRANTDEEREKVLGLVDAVVDIYDLLGEMPVGEGVRVSRAFVPLDSFSGRSRSSTRLDLPGVFVGGHGGSVRCSWLNASFLWEWPGDLRAVAAEEWHRMQGT